MPSKERYAKDREKYRTWNIAWRAKNPWYDSWKNARCRCEDPDHKSYKYYGPFNIKFRLTQEECKRLWERDQAHLLTWASLDRRDSTGDYCFDNCRFIEQVENSRLPRLMSKSTWED